MVLCHWNVGFEGRGRDDTGKRERSWIIDSCILCPGIWIGLSLFSVAIDLGLRQSKLQTSTPLLILLKVREMGEKSQRDGIV